ncbi:MAG: thiamine pyrophosphate-dependent enzyme [Bacteroidales bacterium]|jgi:pyruvate ferredoxin oxidoreductase beta subunit|nr:thiamine pyrophosphate-dependent enzyme [Bacteroidales bacterium]
MPSLQQMALKESAFSGGHRMCAGCPVPIITKMLTQVTDHEVVAVSATGCLEVASSIFPYSAWKIPWVHTAFENAAATMSGIETMYRVRKKKGEIDKEIKFVAIGGDGGTYDIGLQSLSGAMERGHDMLYICYDNGAYMNTGIQRSSATPLGASTTTTPSSDVNSGKKQHRKDLTAIMVAHNLPYIAQASVHKPVDLSNKIKLGLETEGPCFLNVLTPCIPGWAIAPDFAIQAARMAVEANFWPLYEVIDGQYKINYQPKERQPIKDWLFLQGRFKHLKDPQWESVIEELQSEIDHQWERLLSKENC